MYLKAALALLSLLTLAQYSNGQKLTGSIRGYKIENVPINISQSSPTDKSSNDIDIFVKFGEPKLSLPGIFAAQVEIDAEFVHVRQSGKVDFLTFKDIRVNGVAVEVDDYKYSFSFKKGEKTLLAHPARGTITLTGFLKVAYKELVETQREWRVTGVVFVFGRFKKYGFSFKRVVPVELDLKISNPLR